jgi:hypothetical protein
MRNNYLIKKIINIMILVSLLLIIAGATSVTAKSLGQSWGWTIAGYDAGWIIIIIGIIIGILSLPQLDILSTKIFGSLALAAIIFGGALVGIQVAPEQPAAAITDCCEIDFTAAAINSGGDYITDTTWDENTNTLTIPLTVADSSDGNLTGSAAGINITLDPIGQGKTTQDLCNIDVSSDYTFKYGGEDVLDKTGNSYRAEVTTSSGTEYYTDTVKVSADTTAWVNVSWFFINATSGSWVSELSQIGNSLTWYITLSNACNEQKTITVIAMVISYTA